MFILFRHSQQHCTSHRNCIKYFPVLVRREIWNVKSWNVTKHNPNINPPTESHIISYAQIPSINKKSSFFSWISFVCCRMCFTVLGWKSSSRRSTRSFSAYSNKFTGTTNYITKGNYCWRGTTKIFAHKTVTGSTRYVWLAVPFIVWLCRGIIVVWYSVLVFGLIWKYFDHVLWLSCICFWSALCDGKTAMFITQLTIFCWDSFEKLVLMELNGWMNNVNWFEVKPQSQFKSQFHERDCS